MATDPQSEPFVDAIAAGEFLHLRPHRVLEMARRGEIPAYPLGQGKRRVWRFLLSELTAALRTRSVDYPRQSPAACPAGRQIGVAFTAVSAGKSGLMVIQIR